MLQLLIDWFPDLDINFEVPTQVVPLWQTREKWKVNHFLNRTPPGTWSTKFDSPRFDQSLARQLSRLRGTGHRCNSRSTCRQRCTCSTTCRRPGRNSRLIASQWCPAAHYSLIRGRKRVAGNTFISSQTGPEWFPSTFPTLPKVFFGSCGFPLVGLIVVPINIRFPDSGSRNWKFLNFS